MPPRSQPKATTQDEFVDAVKCLTEEVVQMNSYLKVLMDTADDLRDQISYILNNKDEIFPLMVRSMPSDPTAQPFRINEAPIQPETVPDVPKAPQRPKSGPKKSLFPTE